MPERFCWVSEIFQKLSMGCSKNIPALEAPVCLLLFMITEDICMKTGFSQSSEGSASCCWFSPEAIILHLWLHNHLPGG